MKYNIFGYLIGEGFSNVFKNKKSTGASLMIMCATMIIFGIFLILGENINHFVAQVESAQGIQVFINNDTTQEQIDEIGDKIRQINGVSTVEYVSKDEFASFLERIDYKHAKWKVLSKAFLDDKIYVTVKSRSTNNKIVEYWFSDLHTCLWDVDDEWTDFLYNRVLKQWLEDYYNKK